MYKKKDLKRYSHLADNYKKRLVQELEKLNVKYKIGMISKIEYEDKLNTLLRGKKVDDWINYYNKYKDSCTELIKEDENDVRFRAILLISLLAILIIPFIANYSGYSVSNFKRTVEINAVVSPEAYLLIDGRAEPIPLEVTQFNGEYVYQIEKLDFDGYVKSVQIIDKGNVVFSKDLT